MKRLCCSIVCVLLMCTIALAAYAEEYVPFQNNVIRLAIAGTSGLQASIDGYVDGVRVELDTEVDQKPRQCVLPVPHLPRNSGE